MTRKTVVPLMSALIALLLSGRVLLGQDALEPPEALQPLSSPLPPDPPLAQTYLLGGESRAWLGVRLSDISADKARELKLSGEYGVIVEDVEEGSPAAKAGLAKSDVILEFAGERVRSVAQLQRLVRETPAGRAVSLQISRAGETRTLSVKPEARGGSFAFSGIHPPDFGNFDFGGRDFKFKIASRGASLGITGEDLTKQLADYFGVKQGQGVLVREVLVGGPAEKAGLKAGDVIVKVGGQEVKSVSELRRALPRDFEDKRKVTLTVVRDRREQTLTVELEALERYPLRRVEMFGDPGLDARAIEEWADAYTRQAVELSKRILKYQRELGEQSRRWQREWQSYGDGYGRQLRKELEFNRHQAIMDGVI